MPSSHIGIVIGDVTDTGLHAAVVVGRIQRAACLCAGIHGPGRRPHTPSRKVQLFEPEAMATAIYAIAEPDLTAVTLSSAGHPPLRSSPRRDPVS